MKKVLVAGATGYLRIAADKLFVIGDRDKY